MAKKKYTAAQTMAYHSGMGYAVCEQNRNIKFTSEDVKNSFLAGCEVGKKKALANAKKYPHRKK
ncbi:MAG: hypothetical protein NC131_17685 [Roseburia sp.]|nr:hypothetical protein [Roseburia sp.]